MTISNDNNVKFTCADNSANGYSLATYNFSDAIGTDATAIKIEFAYWIPNENSAYYRYFTIGQANLRTGFAKQSYTTAGAMFGMGLKRGKWNNTGNNVNYFSVNNGFTSQSGDNVLGTWARAEVYIDLVNKKISYKITSVDGTNTYFSANNVSYMDENAAICNQIDFYDCANNAVSYLDNLVITKYVTHTCDYTVKAFFGETELETISQGNVDIDTEITYAISKYIIKDGVLYQASTLDNNHHYVSTTTISENNQVVKVTYTRPSITGTPVYFADFGDTPSTSGSSTEYMRCSGGQTSTKNGTFTLIPEGTLADGTYKIEICHYKNRTPLFYVGTSKVGVCNSFSNGGTLGTSTFNDVVVINGAAITVRPNTSTYVDNMDYVLATKISDETNITATITPTGYATFSSPYALDFSNQIENLDGAYYASAVESGKVTMTKLEQTVPVETGLFLKGKAGETVTIPVAASGTTISGTNYLKPNTSESTVAASTENVHHYVFAYTTSDGSNPGFFNLASPVTLGAGKAYIETATSIKPTGGAKVSILFTDTELTGIVNAEANETTNAKTGKIYNIAGQVVTESYKGIKIIDGKKVF